MGSKGGTGPPLACFLVPSVYDVAGAVIQDIYASGQGGSARIVSNPDAPLAANECLIAVRITDTNINPRNRDYHFMTQTSDGQWADKHGQTGTIQQHGFGVTPGNCNWNVPGLDYNSDIVYIAIVM